MEYARFADGSHSLDYLEKAVSFIKSATNKPEDRKWAVLAVHAALYGVMICNVKGTDADSVCTGKKQRLIDFNEALKRCQEPNSANYGGCSTVLQISETRMTGERARAGFQNRTCSH
jgi:hypothetical protein